MRACQKRQYHHVRETVSGVNPDVLAEVVDWLATPEMNLSVAIEAVSGIEDANVFVQVGEE